MAKIRACITSLIFLLSLSVHTIAADSMILNLTQVKELAVKNSPDIKKLEISIKLAEIKERDSWVDYEKARAKYVEMYGASSFKDQMDAAKKGYDAAQYSVDDLQQTMAMTKKKVEYNVENIYLTILNTLNSIETMKENLSFLLNEVRIERIKLELGMSTLLNVDKKIEQVIQLEKQIKSTEDNLKNLKWQLNHQIGNPEDTQFELAQVTFDPIIIDSDSKGITEKAKEASLAVTQFNRTIEDKKIEIENKKETASDKVEKLQFEIIDTQLAKDETDYTIKTGVENALDKINLTLIQMQNYRRILENEQKNNSLAECQYNLGTLSKIYYDSSKLTLKQAQDNYEKAVYDYYLAQRELQLIIGGVQLK
jgi:hypothetical protein